MKTQQEKIELLDGIISRAEEEQYGVKGNMKTCAEDAELFMRNCARGITYRKWQKEIFPDIRNLLSQANQIGELQRNKKLNDTQWAGLLNNQKRDWINSKNRLINTLKMCKREIELYGEEYHTPDDPFEVLKQRFSELIDQARESVDELEGRVDDIESRLEDAESNADDLESRIDDIESSLEDAESNADDLESCLEEAENSAGSGNQSES